MSQESKLPGEKIAFSEEYLSGENTFDDGELVRSSVIGQTEFNKEERTVSIHSNKSISIPKIGDIVIGLVEASLGQMKFKKESHYLELGETGSTNNLSKTGG